MQQCMYMWSAYFIGIILGTKILLFWDKVNKIRWFVKWNKEIKDNGWFHSHLKYK